jgi:hypothetical protein
MKQITRKRALELAQEAIKQEMLTYYPRIFTDEIAAALYAELAAALNFIETLARQKELL